MTSFWNTFSKLRRTEPAVVPTLQAICLLVRPHATRRAISISRADSSLRMANLLLIEVGEPPVLRRASRAAPRGPEPGGARPTRFTFAIAFEETVGGAPDTLGHLARINASLAVGDRFNTHARPAQAIGPANTAARELGDVDNAIGWT